MLEKMRTHQDFFQFKQGAALTMENTVLEMILSGAAETEHHEIAVYEGLITEAEAMGKQDIVQLLQQNLEQEEHTLEEVKQATEALAREQFAHAA
jgi:ferritin-like metal-binding protein YciE